MIDFSLLSALTIFLASVFLDGLYLWFTTKEMNVNLQGVVVPIGAAVDIIKKHISKRKPEIKTLVADILE